MEMGVILLDWDLEKTCLVLVGVYTTLEYIGFEKRKKERPATEPKRRRTLLRPFGRQQKQREATDATQKRGLEFRFRFHFDLLVILFDRFVYGF